MTEGVEVRIACWASESETLMAIRIQVFVEEQQIPLEIEQDAQDAEALHLLAEDHCGTAVGTARLLSSGQIGRLAVLPNRRGFGIGRALLENAIKAAQTRGDTSVFLHAQVRSLGFYEAAGFRTLGAEFEEAGILHRRMERPIGITFSPPALGPLKIVNADSDRKPYELPSLSDCPANVQVLEGETALANAFVELAAHARRELLIYSQDLDPRYFDRPELLQVLSNFARRHNRADVQLLVHDTRRMIQDGHGLLELARRLSSSVTIRVVHPAMQDREDTFMLADRTGMIDIPRSTTPAGLKNLNNSPLARQYANLFKRLHERSLSDPNLRQMSI